MQAKHALVTRVVAVPRAKRAADARAASHVEVHQNVGRERTGSGARCPMWGAKCVTLFLGTMAVVAVTGLGVMWKNDLFLYMGLGGAIGMLCVVCYDDSEVRP